MTDTNVIKLAQPGTFADPLTEILRNGARTLAPGVPKGAANLPILAKNPTLVARVSDGVDAPDGIDVPR